MQEEEPSAAEHQQAEAVASVYRGVPATHFHLFDGLRADAQRLE